MDELVGTPNSVSPIETARNRLAIALFSVCLVVLAIWLLIERPTKLHERRQANLVKHLQYWTDVERRRLRLEENETAFFKEALTDLLLNVCVADGAAQHLRKRYEQETNVKNVRTYDGGTTTYHDTYAGSPSYRYYAGSPVKDVPLRCKPGFSPFGAVFSDVPKASLALGRTQASLEGTPTEKAIRAVFDEHLTPVVRELLFAAYGDPRLVETIRSWWSWQVQRTWLAQGNFVVYDYSAPYIYDGTTYALYSSSTISSKRISDRSNPTDDADTEHALNI